MLVETHGIYAASITVVQAESELVNGVYQLSAEMRYQFSPQILDALQNGVPIPIALDMIIYRKRTLLWDELITELKQQFELRYLALINKYVVKNINSGFEESFVKLESMLDFLRIIEGLPLVDQNILSKQERYYALIRSRIDVEELPIPLRLRAYVSSSWDLASPWYQCAL